MKSFKKVYALKIFLIACLFCVGGGLLFLFCFLCLESLLTGLLNNNNNKIVNFNWMADGLCSLALAFSLEDSIP